MRPGEVWRKPTAQHQREQSAGQPLLPRPLKQPESRPVPCCQAPQAPRAGTQEPAECPSPGDASASPAFSQSTHDLQEWRTVPSPRKGPPPPVLGGSQGLWVIAFQEGPPLAG